jgi:hypothetical protein
VTGEWLPPQAPGGRPPPPVPPGAPPPPPPFEPADADRAPQPPPRDEPPSQPPNNEAVVAISCAVAGAGLLYWSNGLSSVVSLILGIVAVPYARRARRNVEEGRTTRHADLATAAGIAGWITIALSVLAIAAWTVVIVVFDAFGDYQGGPIVDWE